MSFWQFEQGFKHVKVVFASVFHLLAFIARFSTSVDRILQRRDALVVTSINALFTTAFSMPSLHTFLIPRVSLILLSIDTLTYSAQNVVFNQTLILNLYDIFVFLLLLKSCIVLCLILLMVCIHGLLLISFFFLYHLVHPPVFDAALGKLMLLNPNWTQKYKL